MADHYANEKTVGDAQVDDTVRHHEHMSAGRYFATRFSTLKPPMNKAPNPFKLVLLLNKRQWAFFFIGFIAWVCPMIKNGQEHVTN
jgi:MFS transporter, SHS family, lactate transporter